MFSGFGNVLFLTCSQTLTGQKPEVTLANFGGRRQLYVRHFRQAELAMRGERNICSRCSSLLACQNHTGCWFMLALDDGYGR